MLRWKDDGNGSEARTWRPIRCIYQITFHPRRRAYDWVDKRYRVIPDHYQLTFRSRSTTKEPNKVCDRFRSLEDAKRFAEEYHQQWADELKMDELEMADV